VSNVGATLLVIAVLLGLALYFVIVPPPGFEAIGHRLAMPLVLAVAALTMFESLKMRAHVAELVGALRGLLGRKGGTPRAEVKKEAIEILVKSMRSENASVRHTARGQLRNLTGQDLGESAEDWERWWAVNREHFGAPPG
jgi:hypothetical protein